MSNNMMPVVLMLLSVVYVVGSEYVNEYDKPFTFYCPRGQSISRVGGHHNNHAEDRRFSFSCKWTGTQSRCQWHHYANDWDQQLLFQCPGNSVISGISSYHHNKHEDRRFKFYCCTLKSKTLDSCQFSHYANYWDDTLDYNVPSGHALKGASSHHSNDREDRRWKFESCRIH